MRRRTLLSAAAVTSICTPGCLTTSGGESDHNDVRLCSLTAEPESSNLEITSSSNNRLVFAESFTLSARTFSDSTPQARCERYTDVVRADDTYRITVQLQSGLSESYEWDGDQTLQVLFEKEWIRFKELADASP